jgi:YHS domain-containing protein
MIDMFDKHVETIPRKESLTMAKDPVCGMEENEKSAANKTVYEGKTYYFCCAGCKKTFEKDPQRYLGAETPSAGHQHHHQH